MGGLFSRRNGFYAAVLLFAGAFIQACSPSWAELAQDDRAAARLLFERGSREASQGDFNLARQDLADSVAKDPLNAQTHYRLALVYLQLDELLKAIDSLESAISLGQRNAKIYYVYASACAQYGENDKAAEAYREAAKLDPNMINAYHDLGLLYLKTGDTEKAIDSFGKALAIKKDLPKTLLAIGMAYIRAGKTALVMEYITSLRELNEEAKAATLENLLRGTKATQRLKPEPDASNLVSDPVPESMPQAPGPPRARPN